MPIRTRTNFVKGSTDAALANSGVDATLSSPGLADLPAVDSAKGEIAVLVLDPDASAGAPEIVYVSSHAAAATTATIQRAKEGTAFRAHASGTRWIHAPTKQDYEPFLGIFGDASDGDRTLSNGGAAPPGMTAVTATEFRMDRDCFYGDLTINSGITLRVNSFRLFCRGTLTNNGTVQHNGKNGGAPTAGGQTPSSGDASQTTLGRGQPGGAGGSAGGNGAAGTNGGLGGSAGGGGSGNLTTGGSGGSNASLVSFPRFIPVALYAAELAESGWTVHKGGAGGGGGGADGTNAGGGGGGGGGVIVIVARRFINAGSVEAKGGNGGAASVSTAGRGGGGGGGAIVWVFQEKSGAGTTSVVGGIQGTLGGAAADGADGRFIELQV